jgi:hypothetical protein
MDLEKIKDRLPKCLKQHKPVLFCGGDSTNILNLILGIHIDKGGVTDAVKFIGVKENEPGPDSNTPGYLIPENSYLIEAAECNGVENEPDSNVFLEKITEQMQKVMNIYDAKYSEIMSNKLDNYFHSFIDKIGLKASRAFESTKKSWLYIDYQNSEIYKDLAASGCWVIFDLLIDSIKKGSLPIKGRYLYDFKGTLFLNNLTCNNTNNRDIEHYCKLGKEIENKKFSVNWLVAYAPHISDNFPKIFLDQFELVSLDSKTLKPKKKGIDSLDDVKFEISVDSMSNHILDALVSSKDIANEKLPLEDRFLAPLYLLAKAVMNDEMEGWVLNKDLEKKCLGDGVDKAKYEITKAFKKIIGKRAESIIDIKYGSAKKLMLQKKNITFK